MNDNDSHDAASTWGDNDTLFFFELTPDRILEAVERSGLQTTGRCLQLNSLENRVYEVELDIRDDSISPRSPERFRIIKFYRPGRWSSEQILEEHSLLSELHEAELPVIKPEPFSDGSTLHTDPKSNLLYTVFPKQGGRLLDELSEELLEQFGRLVARMHNISATKEFSHRLTLDVETYGWQNFDFLLDAGVVPDEMLDSFEQTTETLLETMAPLFDDLYYHRIHGDCHRGNILWAHEEPFVVDFDDCVTGPAVQDIWLLVGGNDEESIQKREKFLTGYEQMRDFDRGSLRCIEALRALRYIHFAAWISKRWDDPAFPNAFPEFGTPRYWQELITDLREQLALIQQAQYGGEMY